MSLIQNNDRHKQLSNKLTQHGMFLTRIRLNDCLVEKTIPTDALCVTLKIEGCYSAQNSLFGTKLTLGVLSVILEAKNQ
jgi:hypothetical protein